MIQLKRVYDKAAPEDGKRFLVERLWPRGIKKSDLRVEAWLKEIGPSTSLRQWFGHDPKRWDEFRRRYFQELEKNIGACKPIERAAAQGRVTLVYSSHDEEHNNAVALKEFLETKWKGSETVERLRHRKAAALLWLGKELPAWPEPCPIKVAITFSGVGGATSFSFDN